MIYLLDTNVVAWFHTTPRPNRYLSVVTVAEIEVGVAATTDPLRQARYAQALATLRTEYRHRIAVVGEREAAAYLSLHKSLKRTGQPVDPPDALIAATALANGWTLASRNTKHLARTGVELVNPWKNQG